jgi:hypothetical protein
VAIAPSRRAISKTRGYSSLQRLPNLVIASQESSQWHATTVHFTLTHSQRQELEAWLDRQSEQPVEIFTVAFTVTPQGVQVRAYVDDRNSVKEFSEIPRDADGVETDDCYLQLAEDVMFNLTPTHRVGDVQIRASSEGIWFNRGDELQAGPCWAYMARVDDPLGTLIPSSS